MAACSGNLGGGQSTLPGTMQNGTNPQGFATAAAATPTPVSASNVATVNDTETAQVLPAVAGWGGSIAFPKPSAAPSATPNPKATAAPAEAGAGGPVSVGITSSVVEPSDAPHLGTGAKHRSKHDTSPAGLLFISLLATTDVAFAEYPKIAVDVPRDIVTKHLGDTFGLALYDPEQKEKSYRLGVAERDLSSPAPGTLPSATPAPTPVPTAAPSALMPNGMPAFTPPPVGTGLGSDLPPERIAFKGTAANLTLRANRPVVFALYAVPAPSPSPSPSPTSAVPVPASSALASPGPSSSP